MTKFILLCVMSVSITCAFSQGHYINLSQQLLIAVKYDEDCTSKIDSLANVLPEVLLNDLNTEDSKKAFWLNIYNSFVQLQLKKQPEKYKNRKSFYKAKNITIAKQTLSLDNIEHGIIRHSKNKLLLGYVNKLFVSKFEKKFRCKKLDNRIHFALNCGAKSCPPILFYDSKKIDQQLTEATKGYLLSECEIKNDVIYVPVLFSWFRGDFHGKKNIKKFLLEYNIINPTQNINTIKFIKYNWTLTLSQYQ